MVFNLAYKGIFDTYLMDDSTMFKNVQVKDALYKIQIYFAKIIKSNGSFGQIQKICHLAAETCTKFSDNHEFNQKLYIRLIYLIAQSRNYFLLYLLDILIKNTRQIMKQAKNDIVRLFKLVWEQTWQEYKNNLKLECLKAMVKTWNLIYSSQNIQQSVETWLRQNYGSNLTLQKKYQDIYLEVYEKYKPVEKKEKQKEKVENQVIKSQQERRNQAAYQQLLISLQ